VTSNVSRFDYAGSDACTPCHADIAARWQKTPMHNMTRLIDKAAVSAPFDGTVFHFKTDYVTLETHNNVKYMRLETKEKGQLLFRVTKVIGGRHREDFAGVQVNDKGDVLDAEDKILPVSFMRATKELRYKGYSVMDSERPSIRPGGEWRKRCIFCHNTEPYLTVMLGAISPSKPYQGVVVDSLLPSSKQAKFEITNFDKFRDAVYDEARRLDVNDGVQVARASDIASTVERGIHAIRARFDERNLLEVGIGCEACHGGSIEHVRDPRTKPSLTPRAPWLSVDVPKGTDAHAQSVTRTCARCHQVLFSAYSYTWEGGLRAKSPGGSNINSGEARDFLLGGCASKMTCTACHDPHAPAETPRSDNGVCTPCHQGKETKEHSHHESVTCVGCHMPRKNMGLAGKLVRYHRIGSPTDKTRVENDRPLECALCHEKKSAKELVEQMETWWGKTYDRPPLHGLYGNLEGSAILETLSRGKPHEQAVAIAIAGETKLRPAVPFLVPHMTHSVPLLRYWALDSLTQILGGPADVDLHRDTAEIAKKTRAWIVTKGYVLP
jgi:hypothetical protein